MSRLLILLLLCLLVGACSSNQEAAIDMPVVANTPNPVAQAPTTEPSPTQVEEPTETPLPQPTPTNPVVVTATATRWPVEPNSFLIDLPPDEAPMVLVPAGEFLMGSTLEQVESWNQEWLDEHLKGPPYIPDVDGYPYAFVDELYQFPVYLEQFEIDKFEVINVHYQLCVEAGVCQPPNSVQRHPDYPVDGVTWEDATAYCEWVAKRLPTEAEWEKAARGTDGRIYPWGNEWDENRLNPSYKKSERLEGVGSFPDGASPDGALDMLGNVAEWTADHYASYPGTSLPEEAREPYGEPVIRGGYLYQAETPHLQYRTALRHGVRGFQKADRNNQEGFRCARGQKPPPLIEAVVTITAPPPLPTRSTVELSDMVFIPAGEFIMGTDDPPPSYVQSNTPAHLVNLDEFLIDRYEVTNEQFSTFLNLLGQHKWACQGVDCIDLSPRAVRNGGIEIEFAEGSYVPFAGRENVPVIATSYGAFSYCQWQGKRLPTEAEWEKAARGTDGRKYPWGNEKYQWDEIGRQKPSSEVGSHPRDSSVFGVFDMSGNAQEWVADWYDRNYYSYSPANNPLGPAEPPSYRERVVRGSSPDRGIIERHGYGPLADTGFRCAYSP